MSLYINRLRHKGKVPKLSNYNGDIKQLIYNGIKSNEIAEIAPEPTINYKNYIWTGNPNTNHDTWIDTGIYSSNDRIMTFNGTIRNTNGYLYFGHIGGATPNNLDDTHDYRFFYVDGTRYLDVGTSRFTSRGTLSGQYEIIVKINGSKCYLYINGSTMINGSTYSGTPNTQPIFIVLNSLSCSSFSISDNSGNLLFEGKAALDTDNVACLYDTVSKTYKYANNTIYAA